MRVPVDRLNMEEMLQYGPESIQAIEAGIEWILEIGKCICESTRLSRRKTNEDILEISKF